MCKFSKGLELDRDVVFSEEMTETITFHAANGKILWCWARQQIDDPAKYVGTMPTAWIDPADHLRVRHAIAVAAKGGTVGPVKYLLNPKLYGGKSWQVETEWLRGPAGAPVVGISRTLEALPKLTQAEQKLFRQIATEGEDCNVRDRQAKSIARRSAESRLARKLKISTKQLAPFCAAYASLIG